MKRVSLFILALAACDEPPADIVRLEFVPSPSCGLRYEEWDADCLGDLDVRIVDAGDSSQILAEECQQVTASFVTLRDLLFPSSRLTVLPDAKKASNVRIELRAHNNHGNEPCDTFYAENLMVWGSSGVVDLTSTGDEPINVLVECRPECDCFDLRTGSTCPPAMDGLGVCGPISPVPCVPATCDADIECRRGLRVCDNHTCQVAEGRECAPCSAAAPCAPGYLCVDRDEGGIVETFCTPSCPADDVSTCPSTMMCHQLDGVRYAEAE
jgi:hypothetical protein